MQPTYFGRDRRIPVDPITNTGTVGSTQLVAATANVQGNAFHILRVARVQASVRTAAATLIIYAGAVEKFRRQIGAGESIDEDNIRGVDNRVDSSLDLNYEWADSALAVTTLEVEYML